MKAYILHPLAIIIFAPIWIAVAIVLAAAAIVAGPAAILRTRGAKG